MPSSPFVRRCIASFIFISFLFVPCSGQEAFPPFYPGGTYNPAIATPDAALGFPLGQRPARFDEAVKYFQTLVGQSPRITMKEMGETYEHRKQYLLTISSEENQKRAEDIRNNLGKLADPRKTSTSDAQNIIDTSPAILWIGYGIHGDEISSVDAAIQIAYQLVAGTDPATTAILKELIVCIDPMENPDGRERWLSQMQQWAGEVVNSDGQSMAHSGSWPYGRANHYLFDMNRDWFSLVNVENQNRIRTIFQWHPQVLIDSHEMGSFDTYLFSPPRPPINPNVPEHSKKWWYVFAADQAKAFDQYGWSYYTREWNDEWFPGYGSSYGLYIDAVGILYEQAGSDGSIIKRPDGTTLSYRDGVHHHFVSSFTNFSTAANHRKEILSDFYNSKKKGLSLEKNDPRAFYILPGNNPTRAERLVQRLLYQSIEVSKATKEFRVSEAHDYWGTKPLAKTLPEGTYIVSLSQPNGRLAKAILEFDPRMNNSVLLEERKSLEKSKDSRMYDVTAWSLPIAYGLEAYWSPEDISAASTMVTEIQKPTASVQNPKPLYGYIFEYNDDRAVEMLLRLMEKGYTLRCAQEPFSVEGKSYGRGTILLRLSENSKTLAEEIQLISQKVGVNVTGVNTALSRSGSDLGGNDFVLLTEPRIAILAGPEVSSTGFGEIWKLFDEQLKMRVTVLGTSALASADLKKYNVIIMPPGGRYGRLFGKGGIGVLKQWVEDGGTLIGVSDAAEYIADSANGVSNTALRQQALKDLELYKKAMEMEERAFSPVIDSAAIWEGKPSKKDTAKKSESAGDKELAAQDEAGQLFSPVGTLMCVDLNEEHWLNFGAGEKVAALFSGSLALLSKDPVQTPARFSGYEKLRVAGLLWPEARARWAKTSYATCEGKGKGQIILFTGDPVFRGGCPGTERLFLNSVFLGPGFGAYHPVKW